MYNKGYVGGDYKFLSTPSARRATYNGSMFTKSFEISIHALREEGDTQQHRTWSIFSNFYPRPPRGGRLVMRIIAAWSMLFLSTPSARRATLWRSAASYLLSISIHALREEGDTWAFFAIAVAVFISIHALREEGDMGIDIVKNWRKEFLSTPSARRATNAISKSH